MKRALHDLYKLILFIGLWNLPNSLRKILAANFMENKRRRWYPVSVHLCAVSFVGASGVKNTAEVHADSLYEAAAEGIRTISEQWGQEPAAMTPIMVEVKPSPAAHQLLVPHQLTLRQIRSWLESTSPTPKDAVMKQRVKARLGNVG